MMARDRAYCPLPSSCHGPLPPALLPCHCSPQPAPHPGQSVAGAPEASARPPTISDSAVESQEAAAGGNSVKQAVPVHARCGQRHSLGAWGQDGAQVLSQPPHWESQFSRRMWGQCPLAKTVKSRRERSLSGRGILAQAAAVAHTRLAAPPSTRGAGSAPRVAHLGCLRLWHQKLGPRTHWSVPSSVSLGSWQARSRAEGGGVHHVPEGLHEHGLVLAHSGRTASRRAGAGCRRRA